MFTNFFNHSSNYISTIKRDNKILLSFLLLALITLTSTFKDYDQALASEDSKKLNGPARAIWLNENTFSLRLAPGLLPESHLKFAITDGTQSWNLNATNLNSNDQQTTSETLVVNLYLEQKQNLNIDSLIKKPIKIQTLDHRGNILDETNIQLYPLLDQLYFYTGDDLGAQFGRNQFQIKLWSPTAQTVELYLYRNALASAMTPDEIFPMKYDNGIWSVNLSSQYKESYYLYRITNYFPQYNKTETVFVTDPYSVSLSTNSEKTQLIDIHDESLKPQGWNNLKSQYNDQPTDYIIYETHIRDWTVGDDSLSTSEKGSYSALLNHNSKSYRYLKELAENGVTHLHLLPLFDFASVNENKLEWKFLDVPSGITKDSSEPQALLNLIKNQDAYNWGYDPVHYFVPEGSYATDPMGSARIKEFRSFIQSIKQTGLRIVQDVVFNHTFASGNVQYSVLDKIVPLYYYRLDEFGNIENSSCCSDTASENAMMEKLMTDAVLFWAENYKIDAFRFDLMNLHTKQNMLHIQHALKEKFPSSYIYGEAWSFGSLKKKTTEAFDQSQVYGTQIGAFNDRIRDALRGGTTNSEEKSDQGFLTGLFYDFNQEPANHNTPIQQDDQLRLLKHYGDVIKIGLAGNLKEYSFTDANGYPTTGGNYYFKNSPVGFAKSPQENINYISAHDGYTLWDSVQAKAPFYTKGRNPMTATIEEKIRMVQQAFTYILFAQGVPFIEGGSELLRSKSGDQDSYNSGDWFNKIFFSDSSNQNDSSVNNWGVGLPPSWKNLDDWSFWSPRLRDNNFSVNTKHINQVKSYFLAMLRIRQSTPAFKLNSAEAISNQVQFINSVSDDKPGLIAMLIRSAGGRIDKNSVFVIFNSNRIQQIFTHPILKNNWHLHPELNEQIDPALKDFYLDKENANLTIPGRTTVVLIGG